MVFKLAIAEMEFLGLCQMTTGVQTGLGLEVHKVTNQCSNPCWERCLHLVLDSVLPLVKDTCEKPKEKWRGGYVLLCRDHLILRACIKQWLTNIHYLVLKFNLIIRMWVAIFAFVDCLLEIDFNKVETELEDSGQFPCFIVHLTWTGFCVFHTAGRGWMQNCI